MNHWTPILMPPLLVVTVTIVSQILASILANRLTYAQLETWRQWLHVRPWERDGMLYQKIFRIKSWKPLVPEAGSTSPYKFRKKHLQHVDQNYVLQFILESVRAEITHVITVILAIPIAMFCPPKYLIWLFAYTVIMNVPCIIIQRYNRPRFERLYKIQLKQQQRGQAQHDAVPCPSFPGFEK